MTVDPGAVEGILSAIARRAAAADRLAPTDGRDVLGSLASVAVTALGSQAASIALHDRASGRLVFRAAAGPATGGIVGLEIDSESGIAGYAFSTGQPLAVSEVATDPRFERTVAEASGYIPDSLLAVPIVGQDRTLGVLEALDARGGTFSLQDIDLATSVAAAVAAAVEHQRIGRDVVALIGEAIRTAAGGDVSDGPALDALVTRVTGELADDDPTWRLADRIARLRDVDPDAIELAVDWLEALIRHRGSDGRRR